MPDVQRELFSAAPLPQGFEEPTAEEQDPVARPRRMAEESLESSGCEVTLRKFFPPEVPTLHGADDGALQRNVERAREERDALYAAVREGAPGERPGQARP